MTWVSGLCALPFSGRTLSLSAPNEVLFGADGATGLPVDRRLLRTLVRLAACARSHFRAELYPLNRGRAPPAPGAKRTTAGPAGGGGACRKKKSANRTTAGPAAAPLARGDSTASWLTRLGKCERAHAASVMWIWRSPLSTRPTRLLA